MADVNELPIKEPVVDTVVETPEVETPEPKKTLKEELRENMKAIKERDSGEPDKKDKVVPEKIVAVQPEKGRISDTVPAKPREPKAEVLPPIKAPLGWKAETKAQWDKLPREIQAEVDRRETEMEKKLSQVDEERQYGRKLKEVVTPYMPLFNASGTPVEKGITEMLNYAHILQTGTPQSKAQLLWTLAQRWGADMRITPQAAQQPAHQLQSLTQELNTLKQQLAKQPEVLRQQQEESKLKSVIEAFASDPKHPYYEKVKPVMASLLTSGAAKDMEDAYEQACFANPDIRSTLTIEQKKAEEAKRNADKKAKADAARVAASSIKGSAALNGAGTISAPKKSLREELRANFRAATEH
jgi:hypothetical protein